MAKALPGILQTDGCAGASHCWKEGSLVEATTLSGTTNRHRGVTTSKCLYKCLIVDERGATISKWAEGALLQLNVHVDWLSCMHCVLDVDDIVPSTILVHFDIVLSSTL